MKNFIPPNLGKTLMDVIQNLLKSILKQSRVRTYALNAERIFRNTMHEYQCFVL